MKNVELSMVSTDNGNGLIFNLESLNSSQTAIVK